MKRIGGLSSAVFTLCLVLCVSSAFSQNKEEKPFVERIEATLKAGPDSFYFSTIDIKELSEGEELQALAQTFQTGGEDALEKALKKVNKGQIRLGAEVSMPVLVATSSTEGPVRRLNIIALAPVRYAGTFGERVIIGRQGFPYACIQVDLDEQGNGKGHVFVYAKLTFNQHGEMAVQSLYGSPDPLLNVRSKR
jgi:hypothetical protein